MATVTGSISTFVNAVKYPTAEVSLELCGYGSQIPRVNSVALMGQIESTQLPLDASGNFSIVVYGNDTISPAGTYYVLTVADSNGDVVQVNAYRFTASGSYDLNLIDPYDPNQPPPPLPPLITNQLIVMPWAADMQFPGDQYLTYRTTLTGNVTSSELINYQPGNLYTFIIQQDAVGGHTMTWPTNSYNLAAINPAPNGVTVQTIVMGLTFLWPIGPPTWQQT